MMRRFLPSCFLLKQTRASGIIRERITRYDTPIGRIIVIWSHLSIKIYLSNNESRGRIFVHQINPSDPGEQVDRRTFQINSSNNGDPCCLELDWDFSRVKYCTPGDAQPKCKYHLWIADSEGEVIVIEGDLKKRVQKMGIVNSNVYTPIYRKDTVHLNDRSYCTTVNLGGEERKISVKIEREKSAGMTIKMKGVYKKYAVQFKQLWSHESGFKGWGFQSESIGIYWFRHGQSAAESEAGGVDIPKVGLTFRCSRWIGNQPTLSTYVLKLSKSDQDFRDM